MTRNVMGIAFALGGILVSIFVAMSFELGSWTLALLLAPLVCLWAAIYFIRSEGWESAKSAYICIVFLMVSIFMTGSLFVKIHGKAFGL